MTEYSRLPARYSKGILKLQHRLRLPEGARVWVSVTVAASRRRTLKSVRRKFVYPSHSLPAHTLQSIAGIVSLGGDALADSEALYDRD